MLKTIKARYRNGVIEPLEKMDIEDGADITITVSEPDHHWRRRDQKELWRLEGIDRCGSIPEGYLRKPQDFNTPGG